MRMIPENGTKELGNIFFELFLYLQMARLTEQTAYNSNGQKKRLIS